MPNIQFHIITVQDEAVRTAIANSTIKSKSCAETWLVGKVLDGGEGNALLKDVVARM